MTNDEFAYHIEDRPTHTTVAIRGEIDLSNAADLGKVLAEAASRELPVVIDAGELAFIDSAGFAAIQRLLDKATVYLVVPPECSTARSFAVSGLGQVIDIVGSHGELRSRLGEA